MPLKIALSSYSGYGFWFVLRLLEEGHKVDTYLSKHEFANILGDIIPPPILQQKGIEHYPRYDKYDVSLFDLTGKEKQAEFSAQLCPTIGDGAFNCAAEDDRLYGLQVMEECGILVPPYEVFTDTGAAKVFIRKSGKRYVYKPNGGQDQDTETTYVSSSAEDMLANIEKLFIATKGAPFVLQEFIAGTEVSVEGYFNGDEFYLVNCTLEEKKFMNKGHGPNTGCAGNLVFYLRESAELYKKGLELLKPFLRSISFTGMIDLNTILANGKLYGLEWTPRFGYDASATLLNMYGGNLGELFYKVATGQPPEESWKGQFGVGTRISIPPYPSEIKGKHPEGVPIKGIDLEQDALTTYMYDVMCEKDSLVSAGHNGFICVPLTYGGTIADAWAAQDKRIERLKIPNMQIRTDVRETTTKRYNELSREGLL